MTAFRLVAFGDGGPTPWGLSWIPDGDASAQLAVRREPAMAFPTGTLTEDPQGDVWRFEGDGVSLAFTPSAEPVQSQDADDHLRRQDQLCQVTGHIRLDGADAEVSCLGWRSRTETDADLNAFDSLRFLAGWLGERDGFSLLALRPRKARSQESDLLAAVLLDETPLKRVVDPRLSTTYTGDGVPARAGLELWFEEEDPDGADGADTLQYPRRAAGETEGGALDWSQGDFNLHASLLRWHSHGHEGPGVYVLGLRR